MKRHKHKRTDVPLSKLALAKGRKGKPFIRIIGAVVHNEREYTLHTTKGYRSHKA